MDKELEQLLGEWMEDFELKQRELDVYKVKQDVRKTGLANSRPGERLLKVEREDPAFEEKFMVAGNRTSPNIVVDNP